MCLDVYELPLFVTIKGLRNDMKSLEATCSELKGKCEGLESMGSKALGDKYVRGLHLQEENKKIREDKKVSKLYNCTCTCICICAVNMYMYIYIVLYATLACC